MIFTIAGRELRSLFLSPLAWSILAVVQFLCAWLFLAQLETYLTLIQPRIAAMEGAPGVTDLVIAPMLSDAGVIMLLVSPLLTMRLIAEERRTRTLALLQSSPASMTEIVLGKYLAAITFFGVILALLAAMSLSLLAGGALDLGKIGSGLLGLGLMLAAFTAAGLLMSALTAQPTVAAVGTFGLLLLLWIIDWAGQGRGEAGGVFTYLSLLRHYQSLLKGLFNSTDVLYYLLLIGLCLGLAIRRLDAERLQQ